MRKISMFAVIFSITIFACGSSYSIDERRDIQPQPLPVQRPQAPQDAQTNRPILPPAVPPASSGVFPTPSPHISAPSVMSGPMAVPYTPPNPQLPRNMNIMQGVPAYSSAPAVNIPTELPQIPIIGNSMGRVLNVGRDKDSFPWIEVRDDIFDETLKIKINPASTPVIKKTTVLGFNDIKIGDMVNVIFNQTGEEVTANFVSIMTEEDIKAMEEAVEEKEKEGLSEEE